MLKKLRLKFVCITMTVVMVMLCVIFGLVLHLTARNLEQQSLRLLEQAASEPRPMGRPGEQVRKPYFALEEMPDGALMVQGGDLFDLSDEEYLRRILAQAKAAGENTGILEEYGLRYYRSGGMRGQSIFFADITGDRQILASLALTCLAIGIASFGVLLGVSFLLARWAVGPVEKAWQEQRQFVADASHELKTPLTVILTNTELLAEDPGADRAPQLIANVRAVSGQMRGLVESLLELARVDNGAVRQIFTRLCWSDAVSDAVLPFEAVFFEAGLTLETQIQPGLYLQGSGTHLRQVVEILLDNARKYAQPRSAVRLELKAVCCRECELSVSTEGSAIGPEDLKNIFKRFYRVDKARTSNGGYGLGLPIARAIVEDHKGKIWARSEGGINTFFVRLPMSQ